MLASFGEPDSRSLIDGEEQWSYTMYNSQSKATSFIPVVGLLSGGTDSQTKSLTVSFKGDKVSTYIFNAGKSNVKTGFFKKTSVWVKFSLYLKDMGFLSKSDKPKQ